MEVVYVILFAVVAHVLCKYLSRKFSNYPPGPVFHAPILGDLLYLGERPWEICQQWRETYGDIISLQLGSFSCVVLNNYEDIKDAFSQAVFNGLPDLPAINLLRGVMEGIVPSEGHHWMEQRRFISSQFKSFSFGKRSLEAVIAQEVSELLEFLKGTKSNPVNLNRQFDLAILNVLWQVVAGERFDKIDCENYKLIEELKEGLQNLSSSVIATFVPWSGVLAPDLFGCKRLEEITEKSMYFLMGKILEHEMTFDPTNPRDFIDAYLKKMERASGDPESSFNNSNGRANLLSILPSLLVAGSETVSSTLTWVTSCLALYLDVQNKLHEEIDLVIGCTRMPSLEDRSKMIYTEALIAETFRMSSINQFGGFHRATEDAEFKGYKISKNTILIPNQWAVHNDTKLWGDPENFRPERFLSPDRRHFIKKDGILTFSTGQRSCIGESLARDELFIFITSIYQRFKITLNEKQSKTNMRSVSSILANPQLFTVIIHKRH